MRQVFLIFSHKLTSEQQDELKKDYKVERIVHLPIELQTKWSNIPPDICSLKEYLRDIFNWLKENSKKNDFALVQGDVGAVYLIVDFCRLIGLTPIYATTKRVAKERVLSDKSIKIEKYFSHVRFREFENY